MSAAASSSPSVFLEGRKPCVALGNGANLPPMLAAGAPGVPTVSDSQHDLLTTLEARLAEEWAILAAALTRFGQAAQSISKELPAESEFGQHMLAFFSLVSLHVADALFKGADTPLLLDDGAQQLRNLGLSLQEFLREIDLDGHRFLAVSLAHQQFAQFNRAREAGQ